MTQHKQKILFILNGVNNFISHRMGLGIKLQKMGYEVHIAHPVCTDDKVAFLNEQGFCSHFYNISRKSINPFSMIHTLLELHKIIQALQPVIIISVALKSNILSAILHRCRYQNKAKLICLITGLGMMYTRNTLLMIVLRKCFELLTRYLSKTKSLMYIVQNPDDLHYLVNKKVLPKNKAFLVKSSGVDIEQFVAAEEPPGVANVVFAARLLKEKGVFDFIKAIEILNHEGIAANYTIAGGHDAKSLAKFGIKKFSKLCQQTNVNFIGWQENLNTVYAQAHIVCLPSYYREGVPKTILEALACAKPIVTTNMPGCKETVIDGENGFLVPPKDPVKLALALKKLINDSALRKRMGEKSRELAETEFPQQKIIANMINIIQQT